MRIGHAACRPADSAGDCRCPPRRPGKRDEDAAVDQRHVAAYRNLRAEIRVAQRAADAQAVKLDSLGIFQSVRARV